MAEKTPVVYILHGEDEFGIAQRLADLEKRLGDPANAALNTTRLEGPAFQPEQLLAVAGTMPFLAERRLVILVNPIGRLNTKESQAKFLNQLEKVPATTALIVCEDRLLTPERDRRKGKWSWLEEWAEAHPERVWIKAYPLPKGADWTRRIQELARKEGGTFSPGAAEALYELTGGDPRLAAQEVQKLLAYVNYSRPVQIDDVMELTANVGQGDIFAMVDALGNRDGRKALGMLRRLLEYQDYFAIFGMVARQFRLLVQARAILDAGGGRDDILRGLKLYGKTFLADRMIGQARHFSIGELRLIYHRLLDVDEAVKTSQMSGELALETLVTSLTS